MPNYCNNSVSLSFPNQDLYKEFRAFMGDFFSFEKIAPTPTELLNFSSPIKDDKLAEVFMEKYGAKDWYDWRVKNWGTKWDIDKQEFLAMNSHWKEWEHKDVVVLDLNFDTAWAPPIEALAVLGKMFPKMNISIKYFEPGMCFAGESEIVNGELTECEFEYESEDYDRIAEHFGHEEWDELDENTSVNA